MGHGFTTLFILAGLSFLAFGIYQVNFIIKKFSITRRHWQILQYLLSFFVLGYIGFLYLELNRTFSTTTLLVSLIFMGGGLFVSLITYLSKNSMRILDQMKNLEMLNKELKYSAEHDDLTDLYKRSYFESAIKKVIQAPQAGYKYAVMFIDVNDFKSINDTFGHIAGDKILIAIANTLKNRFRSTDIIARLGGDEFAILLPIKKNIVLQSYATELFSRISDISITFQDKIIKSTLSTGIALIHEENDSLTDVIHRADQACYSAKQNKSAGSAFAIAT